MSTKVHPPTAVTFDLPGTVNICTRARRNIEVISFALMMVNIFIKVLLRIAAIFFSAGMVDICTLAHHPIAVIFCAHLMENTYMMALPPTAAIYSTLFEVNMFIQILRNIDLTSSVR